jgi:hypothetical protein
MECLFPVLFCRPGVHSHCY